MNSGGIGRNNPKILRSDDDFGLKLKTANLTPEQPIFKGKRVYVKTAEAAGDFWELHDSHKKDKKSYNTLEINWLLKELVALFALDNVSEENKANLEKLIKKSNIFREKAKHIESIKADDLKLIRLDVGYAYYQQIGDIEKSIECCEKMLDIKGIGAKDQELILKKLIAYHLTQGNDEKVKQYQDQMLLIDNSQEVELEEVDLSVLKERVLKLVENIDEKTISNKIKIIFRRELSKNDLLTLERYLKTLENDHNDQDANFGIDEIFCPQLVSDPSARKNSDIFINKRANFIANLLVDSNGNIDVEVINLIKDLINEKPLNQNASKIHDKILLETLAAVKSNQDITDLLNNLNAPVCHLSNSDPRKHDIESLLRASLGLDEHTTLTARHSKIAVLSAMLTDLRQGPVGSCFITSIAIIVHDKHPLRLAQELKQIIEDGKFEKVINNKVITYNIPKIYISDYFSENRHFHKQRDWKKFFTFPGIRSAIEIAGYDLVRDEKKLEAMYDKVMREKDSFRRSSDVIRSFFHEISMDKAGLDSEDFENREKYEDFVVKRSILITRLNESQDQNEIESIEKDIIDINRELYNINSRFDSKFGVEVNLKSKFEFCDEFNQKLEMNCLASSGDNLLLNIWQYSIASVSGYTYGNEKITFVDTLKRFIASPSNTIGCNFTTIFSSRIGSFINYFIDTERWLSLFSLPKEETKSNVLYILKEILNEIDSIDSNFDKEKFYSEFEKNFNQKLYERLEVRFENGQKIYDKTRATLAGLAIPLTSPKEFSEAIFSIAYHAAENIDAGDPSIKDAVLQKLSCAIQGIPGDSSENLGIMKSVMLLHDCLYKPQEESKMTFRKEIVIFGGFAEGVFRDYVNVPYEVLIFSGEPEAFIINMVMQLDTMLIMGKLDIDPKKEIIFPMIMPGHTFLLRPDMKMLAEVMKNPGVGAIKNWISKTIIQENKPFIIGDLNWGSNGHILLVAIKDSKTNKLSFQCLKETGKVDSQFSATSIKVFFFEKSIESAETQSQVATSTRAAPKKRTSDVLEVSSTAKRRRVEKPISNKDTGEKDTGGTRSATTVPEKRSSDSESSPAKRRRVGHEEQKS